MAILKIEDLTENFEELNCFGSADSIFQENETLQNVESDDHYNERLGMSEFFKRFTISVENAEEFEQWKRKLVDEYYYVSNLVDEKKEEFRQARLEEGLSKELGEKSTKIKKEYEALNVKYTELYKFLGDVSAKEWKANKTATGQKLGKFLKRLGVRQGFLDWSSTQEKSERIIQVTINPTVQAVAGMSNYARRGSWNGHNGTSCQDTRHSEGYTRGLVGAIADNTMYSVQLNYLEDNEALQSHIDCEIETGLTLHEAIESYDINDELSSDILAGDNFQDKLKARTLAKEWKLQEQEEDGDPYSDELREVLSDFYSLGLEMTFLKSIRFYGSDKTRAELKDGMEQISEVMNLVVAR